MPEDQVQRVTLRELDALIHETVMQQCAHTLHAYAHDNRRNWQDYTTYRCRKCKKTFTGLAYHEGDLLCPKYHKDHNAAFEVADRIQTQNPTWEFIVWGGSNRFDPMGWNAVFREFAAEPAISFTPQRGSGFGPTRLIAICKAALGTKGIHVEVITDVGS